MTNQSISFTSTGTRVFWYLECWGLKRIDAWGVSFIISALALVVHRAVSFQTGLLLLAITLNYWLGYWLNDYFDAPHDSEDDAKARQNLFVQHPAMRRYVGAISTLVFGFSSIVFISFGWQGVIVLLVNFSVMWAYSAPPLRLKSRPGLDLLSHALFVQSWPYTICIWLAHANVTSLDGILLGICFLTSLSGQLNQQIRDFEVDSRTDTNFATRVGMAKTILTLKVSTMTAVLLFFAALLSGKLPWMLVPLCLLAVPKIFHFIMHRLDDSRRIFSRRLVYASMFLALSYTVVLMVVGWVV